MDKIEKMLKRANELLEEMKGMIDRGELESGSAGKPSVYLQAYCAVCVVLGELERRLQGEKMQNGGAEPSGVYPQVHACMGKLERVDMHLHDLYATQYFLADSMGQFGDECSRVFSLLNCVVEDIRADVGEALSCVMSACAQLRPEMGSAA